MPEIDLARLLCDLATKRLSYAFLALFFNPARPAET